VRTPRGWWFSPIVEKIETETGAHSNEPTLTSAGVERRGHGVRWRYRIAGHSISMCAQQIGDYLSDIETDVAPRQKPRRRIVHQEATSSPIRF
jgi:hypothetical protein